MPRLYVGGLKDAREADVQAAFAKHGNVARVDMKRGYCFVEMDDENEARDAMKYVAKRSLVNSLVNSYTAPITRDLDGTDLDGAQISVQLSKGAPRRHDGPPRGREGQGERRGERNNYSVSVENMSASTSWQDLKDFAREAGEVLYTVVYNSRGRTVGKIEYGSRNEVQDALRKLDDTRLGGSYVRLREVCIVAVFLLVLCNSQVIYSISMHF